MGREGGDAYLLSKGGAPYLIGGGVFRKRGESETFR